MNLQNTFPFPGISKCLIFPTQYTYISWVFIYITWCMCIYCTNS